MKSYKKSSNLGHQANSIQRDKKPEKRTSAKPQNPLTCMEFDEFESFPCAPICRARNRRTPRARTEQLLEISRAGSRNWERKARAFDGERRDFLYFIFKLFQQKTLTAINVVVSNSNAPPFFPSLSLSLFLSPSSLCFSLLIFIFSLLSNISLSLSLCAFGEIRRIVGGLRAPHNGLGLLEYYESALGFRHSKFQKTKELCFSLFMGSG